MKESFKKWMPDRHRINQVKALRIFGKLIHSPNLWHLNRVSVARAFACGLFCAWIPVPFQMVIAAAFAIVCNCNLPLSMALVWLTNPATMPPLFYFAYKIGAWILSLPPRKFEFKLSLDWLLALIDDMWQPFLLGCLICGIVSAVLGHIGIRLIWRYATIQNWKKRQKRKIHKQLQKQTVRAANSLQKS